MERERSEKEIALFNEFIRHYYSEKDAWEGVKRAMESGLTAKEVMKFF